MQIQKKDSSSEKRILAAMVTDPAALGPIAARWQPEMFKNKWANLIGGWAVKFFEKYDRAPGVEIQAVFERWAENAHDETTVKLVDSFLAGLSADHAAQQPQTAEYIIDLAGAHFNRVKMLRAVEEIQFHIDAGHDDKAADQFADFARVELGAANGIDVLTDTAAIKAAFAEQAEDIITYPEATYHFFRGALTRDAFIPFMGVSGVGKTWWLIDMAGRAMKQKRRVAFFEIGDLSQNQIMRRFMIRAARRPAKAGKIVVPTMIDVPPKRRRAEMTTKKVKFANDLNWKIAKTACEEITGKLGADYPMLRLSCHANGSVGVAEINSILAGWEQRGWIPDVVVLDYADLLNHTIKAESWYQIDDTWKRLRGLSQRLHCLLITATQANAEAIGVDRILPKHFSGARQKIDHSTAFIGISQTAAEKRQGITRLNWLKCREQYFDVTRDCHCAGCLAIGNPAVASVFQ